MDRERARQRLLCGVFVGREGELQRLHHALTEAAAGSPSAVLLHGEAGIGKTALAGELATLAAAEGWWCCRAQSFEPSPGPYAPWEKIVSAVTRGDDPDELRQRLGPLAPAVARLAPARLGRGDAEPVVDDRSEHLALCRGVTELLRDAARRAPVLMLLEDLHTAEASALQLFEYVAAHAGDGRLLLVGTYRDDDAGVGHGARRLGSGLPWGVCERIRVPGLREDEVRAMLEQLAQQPPPARFVARLHAASGGNPLLLVLMLWDLLEAGVLVHDGSAWRSVLSPDDMTFPDSAASLLDRRLDRLSEDTRLVLQLAALYPSDFDVERLGRLGVLPRERLAAGLDAALGTGLIVGAQGPPGRFRFRHGVFRHVLHARIGIAGRAQYHRLIGEGFEARPSLSEPEVLEAAYHFRQAAEAGDVEPAVRWTLRAADLEAARRSHEAAAEHYQRALGLAARGAASDDAWRRWDDAWRLEVLTRRLEALGRAGKLAELRGATRDAVPLARRQGAEALTRVALAAGGNVRGFGRLRYDAEAVALLEEALAADPPDPARRTLLEARLAEELMMGGNDANARARRLRNDALAALPTCNDPRTVAAALRSLQWASWDADGPRARLARADEIVALAASARDDELALEGEIARALAFLELGDPVRARAALGRVSDAARPRPYYRWTLACIEGCLAYVEGRLDDVEALAQEAHRLGVDAEVESAGVVLAAQLGALLWQRGAFSQLDEGLRRLATTEPQAYAAVEAVVRCAQAAGWAEGGRERDALACVEEYARDDVRSIPHNALWLPSMAFLGLACRGEGAAPLARRLYELIAPCAGSHVLLPLMVSYGSVDYFLGLLAEAMGDGDAADRHLEAALEANRRAGTVQWLARTEVALGRRLVAVGTRAALERAGALLDDAEDTARRLGLRAVSDAAAAVRTAMAVAPRANGAAGDVPTYVFRRAGDGFYLKSPEGDGFARYSLGLRDVHRLVRSKGTPLDCIDLVHDGKVPLAENGELIDLAHGGELVDRQTLVETRRRLAELKDALLVAQATGNQAHHATLAEEALDLETYLQAAEDRRGRPRTEPDVFDKAYGAEWQRLRRAFSSMARVCPDMAAHLEQAVRTGKACVYSPDPTCTPEWILA